jgi:hypothetical protein
MVSHGILLAGLKSHTITGTTVNASTRAGNVKGYVQRYPELLNVTT